MSKKFRGLIVYRACGSVPIKNIIDYEKKIGYCLADTYKNLLNEFGGARFEEEDFDFINKNGNNDGRDVAFFCFEKLAKEQEHLNDPDYYGVPDLVAFASTAEGDTMCFDYRNEPNTCEPKIILLVHDEYEEESDGVVHMKVEPIANNFNAFLGMLYKDEDDEE